MLRKKIKVAEFGSFIGFRVMLATKKVMKASEDDLWFLIVMREVRWRRK